MRYVINRLVQKLFRENRHYTEYNRKKQGGINISDETITIVRGATPQHTLRTGESNQ
jgi:hypothetical protein